MSSHNVLHSLIDPGHMAVQATASSTTRPVMSVRLQRLRRLELLMALEAGRVVVAWRMGPFLSNGLVGIVTCHTCELGVAAALHGICEFRAVPRCHPRSKHRPRAGMTARTSPVQITRRSAKIGLCFIRTRFDRKVEADREESGFLELPFCVRL